MLENDKWFCDTCGKLIERVEDGWVEWVTYTDKEGRHTARDLRLVHFRPDCYFNDQVERSKDGGGVSDLPLKSFLGIDGLMYLLSKLSQGEIPTGQLLEMIMRLHIPGYEFARRHFDKALRKGIIEQECYPGYYTQEQISLVLSQNWADDISDA